MFSTALIDSDTFFTRSLASVLIQRKWQIKRLHSYKEAVQEFADKPFPVAAVGWALSDGLGLDFVQLLHSAYMPTKVLFITAPARPELRLLGLQNGADDCINQPVTPLECALRLEKLAQMQKVQINETLSAGEVTIMPETGKLMIADAPYVMRRKEMQILECLFRNKNSVVTREMLIDFVWPGQGVIPTHTTIDVYLRRLRLVLGSSGSLIRTVRGFGYMVCDAPVE